MTIIDWATVWILALLRGSRRRLTNWLKVFSPMPRQLPVLPTLQLPGLFFAGQHLRPRNVIDGTATQTAVRMIRHVQFTIFNSRVIFVVRFQLGRQ